MPNKLRFLLLEDNPHDAELIQRELKKGNYAFELTRIYSREEYVKILDENPPDLILSDYHLPKWTASDALKLLQERRQQIYFILISSSQSEEILIELLRLGADDYILKDHLGRLPSAIESFLKKRLLEMEHRLAQEFIRESEEQYRVLFNKNRNPMWVCDRQNLDILAVNETAVSHYGYSISELLHMSLPDLFLPESADKLKQSIAGTAGSGDGGLTNAGIWKQSKKDGSVIYMDLTWSQIMFYGNKSMLVMGNDVTHSLLAYRRKALQHAVGQVLTSSRSLPEAAPKILEAVCESLELDYGALWALTSPSNHLRCVQVWHRPELGLDRFDDATSRADVAPGEGLLGDALQSRGPVWTQNLDPNEPSGRIRLALDAGLKSAIVCPVLDGDRVIGVIKFLSRNVQQPDSDLLATFSLLGSQIGQFIQRSRAEEGSQLLQEQFRQAQKMEAVGRLAGGMAHDFNNLLTAITGYSDLILGNMQAEDPNRADIEEIKKAARRAATLTRQLLTFSRKQVLQPKVINLKSLLADIESMLNRMASEEISFSIVCDPNTAPVRADPSQIEQVILNLVVNARDAILRTGKISIETGNAVLSESDAKRQLGAHPGPYVVLSVSDTGVGMSAETQSHLFEPFFTTKGKDKGTGLGLSTVYGIVRQAGGYITVESALGKGSTFRIFLPAAQGPLEAPAPQEILTSDLKGTETILLVEDETAVRDMAKRVLQKHGYRVLEARHGRDALLICKEHLKEIDLLLTDIVMPEMNGYELAEKVAAMRPDMRTIFMSGYTDIPALHKKIYDQKTNFLQKPFSSVQLVALLRQVLDKKPANS